MADSDFSTSKQPLSIPAVTGISDDYGIAASTVKLPFLAAGLVNSAVAVLLTQLSSKFFEMAILNHPPDEPPRTTKHDKLEQEQDKLDEQMIANTLSGTDSNTTKQSAFLTTIPYHSEPESHGPTDTSINEPRPKNIVNNSAARLTTGLQPIDMNSFSDAPIFPTSTMESANEPKDLSVEIKQESSEDSLPVVSGYGGLYSNFPAFVPQDMSEHPITNYPCHNSSDIALTSSQPVARIATVDYLKRHVCNFRGCGKIFFSRSSLLCHKQSHATDKPHMCMYPGCGLTFASESLLITHSQLHESKQMRDRHSCSFPGCSKVFVSRECLIEHTRIHTGERPFACDYPGCSHRFARRCNLFAHKRVHLDKNQRRQYHCIHPGCDKTFLYARSLSEHMNVHLGERPYVCDFPGCFKSFTSKSYLYAHRRIHLGSDKTFNNLSGQDESSSVAPIPVTVTIPINPMNQTQFQAFMPTTSIPDSSMLPHHFYPPQSS